MPGGAAMKREWAEQMKTMLFVTLIPLRTPSASRLTDVLYLLWMIAGTSAEEGRDGMPKDTFLIVDGNSLMHRAFHALPEMDADGVPTNAIHGFFMMLFRVLADYSPRYCAVAFDEHAPTFRHTAYPEYKAGRQKTPDSLISQLHLIRSILPALHIPVLTCAGYEADDILGTVSVLCTQRGVQTMLLTGDRDALQLVGNGTTLLFTRHGISETTLFDAPAVKKFFGVNPDQVTDLKGLMGDSSDNIKGVPGVGEKTAVKLLNEYGTLENVLAHAGDIKGKLGEKIRDNEDSARFSKYLATITTSVPISLDLSECVTDRGGDGIPVLQKYKLAAVVRQARRLWPDAPAAGAPEDPSPARPEAETLTTKETVSRFISDAADRPLALHVTPTRLSLATEGRLGLVVLSQDLLSEGLMPKEAWEALTAALSRPLIVHDGKTLLHTLDRLRLPKPAFAWDTMLGQYLLNPQEKSYALSTFEKEDAFGVMALCRKQQTALREKNMDVLMRDVEMPLLTVLYDMENAGFQVDGKVLAALGEEYVKKAEQLREEVYTLSGVHGFNINSPQQLGRVLFETLGLKAGKKTQRGYSTDADTLEALTDEHPCIAPILAYRSYVKFNSTYIVALQKKADASGRVHTYFDQTGTATGRISSSEPNLQNIPVRTEPGREIRRAFIAAPGYTLVDADYSQIELRVLAHMSGDAAMTDAFSKNQDIHTRTASEVYDVSMDEVTHEMRSASKAVNFGLVYGISEFGLARNIGISRKEAGDFIRRYFERYPGVKRFMDEAKEKGKAQGYAVTLLGRRRMLPELHSSNAAVRGFGERVAMNMPVQGTAADIIKAAMVKVHEALKTRFPKARLILQVHDELLIEAPDDEAQAVARLLKDTMEQVVKLSVPLLAEVKTGKSWYETK